MRHSDRSTFSRLTLWLLVCLAPSLSALDPDRAISEYTQRRWSIEQGLPQVSATSIVQDRRGYLWIGTFGGLVRFDGVNIEPISSRDCSNRILSLGLDSEGDLWVGTERSGLCVMRDGVLRRVIPSDGIDVGGVGRIRASVRGGIFAATASGLIHTGDGTFSRITVADGLPHDNVMTMLELPDGTIWVGTRDGFCVLRDGVCTRPSWSDPFAGALIKAIERSSDGTIWIGTSIGLYRIRADAVEPVACDCDLGWIHSIVEGRDGAVWVGLSYGGVRRITPALESLRGFDRRTNDSVHVLFPDREGNLWIGTAGDGLLKLGEGTATALEIRRGAEVLPVLPVVAEGGGRAWAGASCAGLVRVGPEGTRFYNTGDGFRNSCVWSLLLDGNGTLWIGSYGDGLYWMSPGSDKVERADGPGTRENLVRAIVEQDERSLLVGTDSGLYRFDKTGRTFELVEQTAGLDIFTIDLQGDEIWLGTRQSLEVLAGDSLRTIDLGGRAANMTVRAIHRDREGRVWVGTYGGGLLRLDQGRAFAFTPRHGIVDSTVSRILEDAQGRLWLTGNRGVTRVVKSELEEVARGSRERVAIDLFDVTDGMPSTETNGGGQPAGFLDPDGKIWIPTISGLAIFDTRRVVANRLRPPVYVVRAVVDGREIDRSATEIVLDSDARNLEIHYTALAFKAPEKVRFRYRLEGFDDAWVEAGNRRVAYYPSIPKGKLVFRVIAANEEGVWNELGDNFSFTMKPRLVETWWFYALCAALLAAALGIVHRIRIRGAAARERVLRLEVARRTAELDRLAKLTEIINAAVTVEDVLDHLYENLRDTVPYDRIGLALLDDDGAVMRSVWSRGRAEPIGIHHGYESPVAGSSLASVLESGSPRIIGDLEQYLAAHPDSESTRRILSEGIRSNLACPLRALGRNVGLIFFSSAEPDAYTPAHAEFLSKIAGHLSLIVGKSKLYEDLLAAKAELETANRDLEQLASLDGLTGLANRRTFDQRLASEWKRAVRAETPLSLLMLDVDCFKPLNDLYGHTAGDDVLRAIARLLTATARRAADLAARYGGEEFAVVLPELDGPTAVALAESLREAVEQLGIRHDASSAAGVVTISIGVATLLPHLDGVSAELVEAADRALYEAKHAGRNRVVTYDRIYSPLR